MLHLFVGSERLSLIVGTKIVEGKLIVLEKNIIHKAPNGHVQYFLLIDPTSRFSQSLRKDYTFTTRMCEAGVNVKVIQDTLGHKDISTTLNIYTDVTKELRRSEFEGLDSYFKNEYNKAANI